MEVRTVGRTAIDRGLRLARFPFDVAANLLPNERGPKNAVTLVIDRADAKVRAAVGGLLHDDDLRSDALRRKLAVDERERAIELRLEAEVKQREADAELSEELKEAARLREQAEREAQARMKRTDEERARRQESARATAAAQKRQVEETERKQRAAEEKRAKRERLEVLEDEAAALDVEADALTATDEAQRLRTAASAAKAARKSTD